VNGKEGGHKEHKAHKKGVRQGRGLFFLVPFVFFVATAFFARFEAYGSIQLAAGCFAVNPWFHDHRRHSRA
jgi:UDP-N-acetylmuramyl pentapeptide phosphotransferase/UDP-N-acetylglucosamine-1-phosphate transferase